MERHQNWVERLNTFLEKSRNKTFRRGHHDCALFAGKAIAAMTGENFTKEYIGQYKNKEQAFELLKERGCKDLIAVAVKHLGEALPSPAYAGRGDVVAVKYQGEMALAIVDLSGRLATTTGKNGLEYYKHQFWLKAWRV